MFSRPTEGLILFETGSGGDWPTAWGRPYYDPFAQIENTAEKEFPAAISKTGHLIKDVKKVILYHFSDWRCGILGPIPLFM